MEGVLRPGLGTQAWKINSPFTRVGWTSEKAGAIAFVHLPVHQGPPRSLLVFPDGRGLQHHNFGLVPPHPRTLVVSS